MSSEEVDRMVQARDEAWADERVAWGAVLGAKQAVDAAARALEEARVAHADKADRWRESDVALSKYMEPRPRQLAYETHMEGGR